MRRLTVVLVSALVGATLAMPAAAQWKWRSKTGQIQYSDTPPPAGTADQDILQRPNGNGQRRVVTAPAASAPSSAASNARVDPELEAKRKKNEQDEAAKKKAEDDKLAAQRAENCARAKSYQRTLDEGMRIARTNEKGEREILDDKQRAEESRRARDVINSECK
jgi:hypothetical protein